MSEYKLLTKHFFKGTQRGQINSLWRKKDIKERIEEYKKALAAEHCFLNEPLNKGQVKRLTIMGIEVPENIKPVKKEKPVKERKPKRNPGDIRLSWKQIDRMRELGVEPPKEMLPDRAKNKKPRKVSQAS